MKGTGKNEWTCEAAIGFDSHSPSDLTVTLCRKPAKLYKGKIFAFELALCEEHKDLANTTLESHK